MPNTYTPQEDKISHFLDIPKEIADLLAWVQEHANLCVMLSLCPLFSMETAQKIRKAINDSLERGNNLLNFCSSQQDYIKLNTKEPSVLASPANLSRQNFHIPLSGANRFENATSHKSSNDSFGKTNSDELSRDILLPSRTYLKKKNAG